MDKKKEDKLINFSSDDSGGTDYSFNSSQEENNDKENETGTFIFSL